MVLSSGEIRQKKSQLSFPSSEWFKAYADELSQDAEWRAIGKFFSCSYMLDVSGEKFILTFVDGVLVNVKSNPLIGPLYSKVEWRAIGKFFSCSYMLDVSGEKFILTFVDGVLVNVKSNPLIGPLYSKDGWSFAIRAPLDTWKKYMQQKPPA